MKSLEHCRVVVCTEQGNFGRVRTATRWARGPPGACFAATSREGVGLLMSLVCFHHILISISFNYFSFKSFHSQRCQDTWKSIRIEHVGWPIRNFQRSDNGKVMQGDSRWFKVMQGVWTQLDLLKHASLGGAPESASAGAGQEQDVDESVRVGELLQLSQLGKTWWLVWSLKTSLDSSTPRPCSQLMAAISWETRYHCTRKPRRQPELSRPERAVRRLGYILSLWAQYGAVDKSST